MNIKKIALYVGLGIFGLILLITLFSSWTDVNPGQEGFIYRPYSGGIDTTHVYQEGTTMIAPWNEMITYNIRQQSRNYESQVMDKNGTDIGMFVAVNYHVEQGKSSKLHLKHGPGYAESFIDKKVKGAIKDVIGRYTYIEVYSTKREALEQEIEHILIQDFAGNFIVLDFVEIADVNLPTNIANEITVKETQKQKQETAREKKLEEKYLAEARFEKARGDSSLLISASYKAQAIELESKALKNNPEYTELKMWEKWDGAGSPYGTGNVFGSGVSILKNQK